jgi:triosephosphate isomerase (TIM)
MRTPLVAGNWKMNKTVEQARDLVFELSLRLRDIHGVDKVLCPPFPALLAAAALLPGTDIHLGAQNMHWEGQGAFTGEVSPLMVKEFCRFVILGHSERRAYFGETDEVVNRKVRAALAHGLTPIFCVGETLEENEAGLTAEVVGRQVQEGLREVDGKAGAGIVVAYEPVWAIGTGRAASSKDAGQVVGEVVRPALAEALGEAAVRDIRVLYGGSVTAANAAEFFGREEIDGALVGGASLKADEFIQITKAAA